MIIIIIIILIIIIMIIIFKLNQPYLGLGENLVA